MQHGFGNTLYVQEKCKQSVEKILTGVDTAEGSADTAGIVDGTSGQCAGHGHGADERGRNVA